MSYETNPYDPPRAPIGAMINEHDSYVISSKWRRFFTLIIDYICFFFCSFCIGVFVALVLGQEGIDQLQSIPDFLLGFMIMTCFYLFFEGIWGRTPGKLICGTKVIHQDGGKPSFGNILGRTLCRFIPFEAFSFLGERGWHDSISKTMVVNTR